MTGPRIGKNIQVRHTDQFSYTLLVKVTTICSPDKFIGIVEAVFGSGIGEILPGNNILNEFKGKEMTFKNTDMIS